MNQILITRTTSRQLPPPEALPDAMEPPREAWLAGLANGMALGATIGAASMYLLLDLIGRVQ
jgi:hypothetical protein